jgi:hypothetical protein
MRMRMRMREKQGEMKDDWKITNRLVDMGWTTDIHGYTATNRPTNLLPLSCHVVRFLNRSTASDL